MFKKSFAILMACCLICSVFAGCVGQRDSDGQQSSTDGGSLVSGENTGAVVPYLGSYNCDEENGYWIDNYYGLMTLDGEKITEPIYGWYQAMECDGVTYYCMKKTQGEYEEEIVVSSLLVKADGTWKLELPDEIISISENRIITRRIADDYKEENTVYDYDANKVFEIDSKYTVGDGYCNGLIVLHDFYSSQPATRVCDENGNAVLDGLDFCGSFETGKAVASYNRDRGYGIINPDGDWLIEPDYVDITSVDGKYFVAVTNTREDIYDADLKLVRTREGWFTGSNMSYFFLTDSGRLIRFYANIDAPDEYYYDAFTDELISSNGIAATGYLDGIKTFYCYDGPSRTAWVFDEECKKFGQYNNTDRIVSQEGAYSVTDGGTIHKYYSAVTYEEMISLPCAENEWKPVSTVAGCDYVAIGELEDKQDSRYGGTYALYNYKTDEYAVEVCEYCVVEEIGESVYITVVYSDRIEIYDAQMNLILKTDNINYVA